MAHRGPDDEGIVTLPGAGLGARRLSIIDVQGGHQPLSNEDETLWVALNGEIYNYQELRAELEARGHRFRTRCDTEVLVHLYEDVGEGFVQRLNGMFAFALWDARLRRLLLARDRCGIKPLYYAATGGCFAFASELRSLLAWPGLKPRLDPTALAQYLMYEYVPTPLTILEGVRKLPPGSLLTLARGEASVQPYWEVDLALSETGPAPSDDEAAEGLRDALRKAVRMEMVSDVPLGVFLSGGIDSSAVTLAMVEAGLGDVRSFSIAFENKSFDESPYARRVAKQLGTRHQEMAFTARELLELVPRVPDLVDEPLGEIGRAHV
jgi:asparagine synthase (glutamine-hydrolysing)